jgi:lipopolysaccharide export system permease protein
MNQLDRLMFASYIRAYLIVLVSFLSLYTVVDLFTNLDDFAKPGLHVGQIAYRIGVYYSYQVVKIFDRLCEAIVLLAAMFTIAWLQRNNELIPMLSAGISTGRVLRPVFIGSSFFLALGVVNQELIIPTIADKLLLDRNELFDDDPYAKPLSSVENANGKPIAPPVDLVQVEGAYDANGVHIEGLAGVRKSQKVFNFCCIIPDHLASGLVHLHAVEARYIPPQVGEPRSGGWHLTAVNPPTVDNFNDPTVLEMIDPGSFFLHTKTITFDTITRSRQWYTLSATSQLRKLLDDSDMQRLAPIAVLFHTRLTRPVLGMLLMFLGLAMILRDQNQHMFISAGLCLLMCALFYAAVFACKYLGENDYLSPALAAWMPVLLFGPLAFSLFDAIHT